MAHPRYRSPGPGHYIQSLSRAGDKVLLEDRSVWSLDPSDAVRVRRWTQWAQVAVEEKGAGYWLVTRCSGHEERVLVGFRGFLAEPASMAMAS
jgi:hypothetical protein